MWSMDTWSYGFKITVTGFITAEACVPVGVDNNPSQWCLGADKRAFNTWASRAFISDLSYSIDSKK